MGTGPSIAIVHVLELGFFLEVEIVLFVGSVKLRDVGAVGIDPLIAIDDIHEDELDVFAVGFRPGWDIVEEVLDAIIQRGIERAPFLDNGKGSGTVVVFERFNRFGNQHYFSFTGRFQQPV